jgi:hypothetical protein
MRRGVAYVSAAILLFIFSTFVVFCLLSPTLRFLPLPSPHFNYTGNRFIDAVANRASEDGWIILIVVDDPYADMAVNLYESSFKPLDINNFLFVGYGQKVCKTFEEPVACYTFPVNQFSSTSSSFGTADFNRKSHRRNNLIIEAISANFTVLYMDADIVFLENPLPQLKIITSKADVAPQWDIHVHNSGFVVVKPTTGARNLYMEMNMFVSRAPEKYNDQQAMNAVIDKQHLSVVKLLPPRFAGGRDYFNAADRKFGNLSTRHCIGLACTAMVHNTWIITKALKIYRFREYLLWMNDNGGYYSSETRKYLTYNNSLDLCTNYSRMPSGLNKINQIQRDSLKAAFAIGFILGRVVILPRFHCGLQCVQCPLYGIVSIVQFDSVFENLYRESTFLENPKVPKSTKMSITDPQTIKTVVKALEKTVEITDEEVKKQFDSRKEKVLFFSSLAFTSVKFLNKDNATWVTDKLARGF